MAVNHPIKQRREIFYDLVRFQDKRQAAGLPIDDTTRIIRVKYRLRRRTMEQLIEEGITKDWPVPDLDIDEKARQNL